MQPVRLILAMTSLRCRRWAFVVKRYLVYASVADVTLTTAQAGQEEEQ